jgi:hypothetical protein
VLKLIFIDFDESDFKKDITIHMSKMPEIDKIVLDEPVKNEEEEEEKEQIKETKQESVLKNEESGTLIDFSVMNKEKKVVTPFDDF